MTIPLIIFKNKENYHEKNSRSLLVIATLLFINVAFSCDPGFGIMILTNVYPGIHKKYQVVKDKTRYTGVAHRIAIPKLEIIILANFWITTKNIVQLLHMKV